MIASPSARAVASTAAAMIAGRAARTVIVHIARQRLTPSASRALRPAARHGAQRVDDDRDHDRRDHHREDHDGHEQLDAVELHHVGDRLLALLGDQVLADERHEHQDADQPVDDRRHRGEQPHDRARATRRTPRRRELDDEDRRRAARRPAPSTTRAERDQRSRRSAARRGARTRTSSGFGGRVEDVGRAAGRRCRRSRTSARPLCANDGHAFAKTKTTMPGDQQQDEGRQRAEHSLGAPVRCPDGCRGPRSTTTRAAPTPCAMIRCARPSSCDPLDELRGRARGAPRVTIQKLRTPPYWPDFALRRLQATPL